jgi:hypothetical protein
VCLDGVCEWGCARDLASSGAFGRSPIGALHAGAKRGVSSDVVAQIDCGDVYMYGANMIDFFPAFRLAVPLDAPSCSHDGVDLSQEISRGKYSRVRGTWRSWAGCSGCLIAYRQTNFCDVEVTSENSATPEVFPVRGAGEERDHLIEMPSVLSGVASGVGCEHRDG